MQIKAGTLRYIPRSRICCDKYKYFIFVLHYFHFYIIVSNILWLSEKHKFHMFSDADNW